jgi:hypothetical protein
MVINEATIGRMAKWGSAICDLISICKAESGGSRHPTRPHNVIMSSHHLRAQQVFRSFGNQ